jgi:hypothetical protein
LILLVVDDIDRIATVEGAVILHDFFGRPHLFNNYGLTLHVVWTVF